MKMVPGEEIMNKFKYPGIVTVTRVRRLEWLEYCKNGWRQDCRMLLDGKQGRGTQKGRPRLSSLDDAELDLRNMGVKRTARDLCVSDSSAASRYDDELRDVLRAVSHFNLLAFSCVYLI
jgi:hypothetical protein